MRPASFRAGRRLGMAVGCVLIALCAAAPLPGLSATCAWAVPGTVYSCTVHPVYRHPVTGAIEDSGGASASATGQAMVESCVSTQGQLEATDSGEYYLTMRMGLMDLTSDHEFMVQDWGSSGWSVPAIGTTGTGSDANGTTSDVCVGIPSARGIVRVSMFVDTMGRDVVFYVYADGASEGAAAGFNATVVTEPSARAAAPAESASGPSGASDAAGGPAEGRAEGAADEAGEPPSATSEGSAQDPAPASGSGSARDAAAEGGATGESAPASADAGSTLSSDAVQSADDQVEGAGAATAQGLSLSTAADVEGGSGEQVSVAGDSADGTAAVLAAAHAIVLEAALAAAIVGVVLMLVASAIAYAFRRNWNRWGGQDPDDYSREYRDEPR